MSAVIPAARLARKRQARTEESRKEFFEVYDQIPPESRSEFGVFLRALVRLSTAPNAVEFAKARKRLFGLVAKMPLLEGRRAQARRLIADWPPPSKRVVLPLAKPLSCR